MAIVRAAVSNRDVNLIKVMNHAVDWVEHRAVGIILAAPLLISQVERRAQRFRESGAALLAPGPAGPRILTAGVSAVPGAARCREQQHQKRQEEAQHRHHRGCRAGSDWGSVTKLEGDHPLQKKRGSEAVSPLRPVPGSLTPRRRV